MAGHGFLPLLPALAVLAGCAAGAPVVSLSAAKHPYSPSSYGRVLDHWTRDAKIVQIDRLDTTLRVHATCLAPDFIEGYTARYEHLFKLPRRVRSRIAQEMNDAWRQSYVFAVGAATTDSRHNDFERKDSIWRVSLVNDLEQQVAPLEIRAEKTISATVKEMYPYVGDFYRFFHVRFPRRLSDGTELVGKDTRHLALRFAGPLGETRLIWRLR